MEFRDALKALRGELGITQVELATALRVNLTTVSRWELGKTFPSRAFVSALSDYATAQNASADRIRDLRDSARSIAKSKLILSGNNLYTVEHASLRQLIDDVSFPIYVCDMETDELLYINRCGEAMLGHELADISDKRCFACLMNRDKPCEFCHKQALEDGKFTGFETLRTADNTCYRIQGKRIRWNGRDAHVHYVTVAKSADGNAGRHDVKPADAVADRLLGVVYETVVAIDADTGGGHRYSGSDIDDVFDKRGETNDGAPDIETVLRGFCTENDIERVIRETSLTYVKRQLETQKVYSVISLCRSGNEISCKRVMYAYLDNTKSVILCGVQDVTDVYRKLKAQLN